MSRLSDVLDVLTERGEAAFAIDASDRVVFWNLPCEALLGRPAREALGRHCCELIGGRDVFGNLYCSRYCPVAHQARAEEDRPVNRFTLLVTDAGGRERRLAVDTFAVPAGRPDLASVVHVLRPAESDAFPEAARELAAGAGEPLAAILARPAAEGPVPELTPREKELLLCMAEGLPTEDIARRLAITASTVRNHTQSILQKLDVHSKLAAVVYAFRHGLI